jgi:hypothetical protein
MSADLLVATVVVELSQQDGPQQSAEEPVSADLLVAAVVAELSQQDGPQQSDKAPVAMAP